MFADLLSPLAKSLQGSGRVFVVGGVLIGLVIAGALVSWRRWGGLVTDRPELLLRVENVDATPPPPWIASDVKADVFRDGTLAKLSVLDAQVTVKVARAFALHPWVASVLRVSKHPGARMVVQLEYRQPIAMVEVSYQQRDGLFPVDAQGILLPARDFENNAEATRNYLRIAAGPTWPAGLEGAPWGDPSIHGAAQIAAAIGPIWKELSLYRIVLTGQTPGRRSSEPSFELQTRSGARVIWGKAPGAEAAGEPSAVEKMTRLVAFVRKHGALDQTTASLPLDLRLRNNGPAALRTVNDVPNDRPRP